MQLGGVFQHDPRGEFGLDGAVPEFECGEGALCVFGFAYEWDVDATVLEIGADGGGGDGDETAIRQAQVQDDFADLFLDQLGHAFDATIAHGIKRANLSMRGNPLPGPLPRRGERRDETAYAVL